MQKKEKLEESVVAKLRELQTKANDSVLGLGEIELRLRELTLETEQTNQAKKEVLEIYDQSIASISSELKNLEITYPKGEIDLIEGVVIFDVAE
jgi:hypothetical protein